VNDLVLNGVFQGCEGATDLERSWRLVGFEERAEEPSVELGAEHRDAQSLGGEGVGVGAGDAGDESVEAEASQVVGHLR
jgi:hypothetical protein